MSTDGGTTGNGIRRGRAREGMLVVLALLAMGIVGFSLWGGGDDDGRGVAGNASVASTDERRESGNGERQGEETMHVQGADSGTVDSSIGGVTGGATTTTTRETAYDSDNESILRESLRRSPNDVRGLCGLSRILLANGRPGEALRLALRASALDGGSSDARRLAGRAYHTLGMTTEARASYESAIRLDPDDAWALNNLGLLAIEEERPSAALPPLALAARLAPGEARIQNNLGIALERSGRVFAAADAFASALAADSTFARAAENLARVRPLRESPRLGPLDLDAIAADFLRELRDGPAVASGEGSAPETLETPDESVGPDEEGGEPR